MQEQAEVQHLQQGLDGKDSGEPVVQHTQLLVPIAILLRTQYVGSRRSKSRGKKQWFGIRLSRKPESDLDLTQKKPRVRGRSDSFSLQVHLSL